MALRAEGAAGRNAEGEMYMGRGWEGQGGARRQLREAALLGLEVLQIGVRQHIEEDTLARLRHGLAEHAHKGVELFEASSLAGNILQVCVGGAVIWVRGKANRPIEFLNSSNVFD